jgi:hypothetical protein
MAVPVPARQAKYRGRSLPPIRRLLSASIAVQDQTTVRSSPLAHPRPCLLKCVLIAIRAAGVGPPPFTQRQRSSGRSSAFVEECVGTKKTGKGRRKLGRKKRRMRSKIRHRK